MKCIIFRGSTLEWQASGFSFEFKKIFISEVSGLIISHYLKAYLLYLRFSVIDIVNRLIFCMRSDIPVLRNH